jgi:hypothetical protein
MKRDVMIYLALFLASYAAFLAAYRFDFFSTPLRANTDRVGGVITQQSARVEPYVTPSSTQDKNVSNESSKASAASSAVSLSVHPVPSPSVAYEMPAVLNIDFSSPRASEELTRTAHFDENAATRIAAVNALRAMAANGDQNGFLREALRTAASDADENVASVARAAYQEVSQWQANR